jgi:hypothetical protein
MNEAINLSGADEVIMIESEVWAITFVFVAAMTWFGAIALQHANLFWKYIGITAIKVGKRTGLAIAPVLITTCLAAAQVNQPSEQMADNDLFLYYYKDPRPERLVGFLERYGRNASSSASPWSAFPPAVGFFAVVFREHPEWIERLIPSHFDARSAVAIDAALQLSGNSAVRQALQPRFAASGSDTTLKGELGSLPSQIMDIQIARPTHLDIFWGAFFSSGDERYVRRIIDFLARTADRSELIAMDVARTAVAMSGGPKEIYGQLREKYDQALGMEIVFAATAGWALGANAQRHENVARAVTTYISEHPSAYATKVLSVLRSR